jgi:hypothetical protein
MSNPSILLFDGEMLSLEFELGEIVTQFEEDDPPARAKT